MYVNRFYICTVKELRIRGLTERVVSCKKKKKMQPRFTNNSRHFHRQTKGRAAPCQRNRCAGNSKRLYINQLAKCNHQNIQCAFSVRTGTQDAISSIYSGYILCANTHLRAGTLGHVRIGGAITQRDTRGLFMIHINQTGRKKKQNTQIHKS